MCRGGGGREGGTNRTRSSREKREALGQNLRGNETKKTLRTLNFPRVQNLQKKRASVIGQIVVIFDGAGTTIE